MRILKGKEIIELNSDDFRNMLQKYTKTEIDLGTGDGRYVYKSAQAYPATLFIGVDPGYNQLEEYSKKALKNGLKNILFAVASLEILPEELNSTADCLHIVLPWGTLLKAIVQPTQDTAKKLADLLKQTGTLNIVFGYVPEREPSEIMRLNLEKINENYVKENIIPVFEQSGLRLLRLEQLSKEQLQEIETTWSKRLSFGRNRPLFKLSFQRI